MAVRQTNAGDQQTLQDTQDLNNPSSQTPTNQGSTTAAGDQTTGGTSSSTASTPSDTGGSSDTSTAANGPATSGSTGSSTASDSGTTGAAASDQAATGSADQTANKSGDTSATANDHGAASTGAGNASDTGASNASDNSAAANDQAAAGDGGQTSAVGQSGEHVYVADLDGLNNSGVDGFAIIQTQADGSVTVNVVAEGAGAEGVAAHINGFTDGKESASPTVQQDADHNGVIGQSEGETAYGPSLANLTSPSSDSTQQTDESAAGTSTTADASTADASTADASTADTSSAASSATAPDGDGTFSETYTFSPEEGAALLKALGGADGLDNNAIVLSDAVADAGAASGGSALPVASGEIQEVTGLSAEIASNLLDHMGSDPSSEELASTFYTVQALQAFAAASGDDASDQTADATGSTGGEPSTAGTSNAASGTTAADDHDTQPTPTASQDHQGDMMFA